MNIQDILSSNPNGLAIISLSDLKEFLREIVKEVDSENRVEKEEYYSSDQVMRRLKIAEAGKLVRDLLGDVILDLLYEAVVLQGGTADVQRKVRAVDHALHGHEELRDDLLDVVRDEHLVVVEFDRSVEAVVLRVDLRKIQDALQVERIIHVQMDPEQRLLIVMEGRAVELAVLLVRALGRRMQKQREDVIDRQKQKDQ